MLSAFFVVDSALPLVPSHTHTLGSRCYFIGRAFRLIRKKLMENKLK